MSVAPPSPKHSNLEAEYAQTNDNFRLLSDIRFKLLAFLPTFGGVAVFALTFAGLSAGGPSKVPAGHELYLVVLVSLLGFVATVGITMYDQRNSELYNALIHRAKYLEAQFKATPSLYTVKDTKTGGQFWERPKKARYLLGVTQMGHDKALAFIYGPVLGAWGFPFVIASLQLLDVRQGYACLWGGAISIVATAVFICELIRQDNADFERWDKAEKQTRELLGQGDKEKSGTRSPEV